MRLLPRVVEPASTAKSTGLSRGADGLPAKRIGARRMADIPPDVLRRLNRGELETASLAESLAVDFRLLLGCVAPHVACPAELAPASEAGITKRLAAAGAALYAADGLDGVPIYSSHPSDTVRGWAAYLIASAPDLSLSRRLRLAQPLANDPHFGVRECAWLALRPHVAAALPAALRSLKRWVTRPSANERRYAIEITRPRGVWCAHLNELKQKPELALGLLEAVRSDEAKYVQDSTANWLNDASKSQPGWVRALTDRWLRESPTDNTRRIVRRALRSLRG